MAINEAAFGEVHPRVIDDIRRLANLYSDEGKHTQAEQLYQRALALGEQVLGPQHPDVISIQEKYKSLFQREKHEE